MVVHESEGNDISDLREDFLELVFRGVVGDVADENGGSRRTTHVVGGSCGEHSTEPQRVFFFVGVGNQGCSRIV